MPIQERIVIVVEETKIFIINTLIGFGPNLYSRQATISATVIFLALSFTFITYLAITFLVYCKPHQNLR